MLKNLKAEMARKNVKGVSIARAIHRSDRCAFEKINGIRQFSIREAMLIRDSFFDGMSLDYLFEQGD